MANTKNLSREERKYAKRQQRLANKALWASMSRKDRNEMLTSEKTMKAFLKEKGRI